MEVLQQSTGLQTCSTYTTLHDTTVTTVTMGFMGKSQSLLMKCNKSMSRLPWLTSLHYHHHHRCPCSCIMPCHTAPFLPYKGQTHNMDPTDVKSGWLNDGSTQWQCFKNLGIHVICSMLLCYDCCIIFCMCYACMIACMICTDFLL